MSRRGLTLAALVNVAVLTAAIAFPGSAQAAPITAFDVVAVGIPTADGGHGAVDVFLPDGTTQHLTPESLQLAGAAGVIRFGSSVAVGDVNHDGLTDVAVGAPGNPRQLGSGSAWLLLGSEDGFDADRARGLSVPGLAGLGFGTAIAVGTQTDTRFSDVWVGAPYDTVSGHAQAGRVYQFQIQNDILTNPAMSPSLAEYDTGDSITQDSALLPDAAETGDRFGAVLAPARDGVFVGDPLEDIGSLKDAGAVYRIYLDPVTGVHRTGSMYTQNRALFAGTAEAGDRFGASVSQDAAAIGVPGEDFGGLTDAGAVQLSVRTDGQDPAPLRLVTLNSPGVPGTAKSGDRFGAAVATGIFSCPGRISAAIGAPGAHVGPNTNAGSVTFVDDDRRSGQGGDCAATTVAEGSGIPGSAEAGDQTGADLATVHADPAAEPRFDTLLIGAPGESVGSAVGTGRVVLRRSPASASAFTSIRGDLTSQHFGGVLGQDAD